MKRRPAAAGLGILLLASGAAMVRAATGSRVLLRSPQVVKLDWNTRSLAARDIDGDGLTDLAVLNNDRARIDLLYQLAEGEKAPAPPAMRTRRWEPVLENARFRKESLTTGVTMYALAAGDLDGDGDADLAYTTKRGTLSIRFQAADGTWEGLRKFEVGETVQWTSTLIVQDLDGDGREDIAVLLRSDLAVFRQLATGELAGPFRYPLADEGCYGLLTRDLDGDGRLDLSYFAQHSNRSWRARFQAGTGEFGPERAFRLPSPGHALQPLATKPGRSPLFATIDPRTRSLNLVRLDNEPPSKTIADFQPRPRYFATTTGGSVPASYCLGDLDGNGLTDVVVADARRARVLVHLQAAGGTFGEPRIYPSFSGVRSIAAGDLDGDGRDELFSLSREEEIIGVSHLADSGRLSYPEPLPSRGTPLALVAADLDGDGDLSVVYARQRDGRREVAVLSRRGGGEWKEQAVELVGLKTNPMGIELVDANQDGRTDVAVFTVQSPVRFLLQDRSGRFHEASPGQGFRQGLVDKVLPANLSVADLDGDGRAEMLVAGRGYVRSLRITGDGQIEIIDQFNARGGDTIIASAAALDLDADGTKELLLVESGGETMQILARDAQGVYRYTRSLTLAKLDLVNSEMPDLDGNGSPDLLLFGSTRFLWLPSGRTDWTRHYRTSYETGIEEMVYTHLAAGDLNGDGHDEIIVADTSNTRILEVLSRDDGGDLYSLMHFTIFEVDPHYSGRQGSRSEPREMTIVDVTGDGRADLVLLIHDRILVYPQG